MNVGFFGSFAAFAPRRPLNDPWIPWLWEWKKKDEQLEETNSRSIRAGCRPRGLYRIDV